jgi:hypothetical protein
MGVYLQKQFLAYCILLSFLVLRFFLTINKGILARTKNRHRKKSDKVQNMTHHNIFTHPSILGIAIRTESPTIHP